MSDTNVHRVVGNLLVGTSHFFVDTTTNRVGVNTSSPSASLDIATGDLKVGSGITIGNNGTITAANFSGNGSGLSDINSDSGSWVKDDANGLVYVANSTHKVGIGLTSPDEKLDIDGGNIRLRSTGTAKIFNHSAGSDYGNLQISSGYQNDAAAPKIDLIGWTGAGTVDGDNLIKFSTNNSVRMCINQSGNVGINQTSPYAKLDVKGFVKGGPGVTSRAPLHISDNTLDSGNGVGNGKARFMMVHTPQDQYHGNEYGLEIGVSGTGNSLLQSIVYTHSTGTTTAAYNLGLQPFGGNVGVGTYSPGHVLDVQGSQAFDGSTTLRVLNPASQYGRTQLHLVGRYEASNDAWSAGGARNAIMFKSQSSQNSGITNQWTIQSFPNGTNNDLGFLAGSDNTPKVTFRGSTGQLLMNGGSMSKPPVVIHIDDTRTGCPPMWGAGLNIMFHTFTLSRTAYVYVSVTTILVYHTRADCHIYFGNSKMQSHLTASDNTSWNPVNITAAGSLGAGTHTISFRCDVANVVGCQGDWGGMQILVFET